MPRPPQNGLESALGNSMPRRFREFAVVPFDGEGAICVPIETWLPASAWATSRQPSGNRLRDRGLLLQRLDVLVTRRGTSIVSTIGSHSKLARLRNAMRAENLDLKEWNFPPDDVLDQAAGAAPKPSAPLPVEGVAPAEPDADDSPAPPPADPSSP